MHISAEFLTNAGCFLSLRGDKKLLPALQIISEVLLITDPLSLIMPEIESKEIAALKRHIVGAYQMKTSTHTHKHTKARVHSS
jgi:hypothetical protein